MAQVFLFQFFNQYFSLFYIAFLKNNVVLFGKPDPCPRRDCYPSLGIQFAAIFGTRIMVAQLKNSVVPKIQDLVMSTVEAVFAPNVKKEEKRKGRPGGRRRLQTTKKVVNTGDLWSAHAFDYFEREPPEPIFEQYDAMIIQLGYISMFSPAFPLAPIIGAINNMIELRTDALSYLETARRPPYAPAEDIGTWMDAMEIVSWVSVLTNVLILGFTSDGMSYFIPQIHDTQHGDYIRLWAIVLTEHLLFGLKYMIQEVLPDEDENDRQAFERANHIMKQWATVDEDDDD